MNELKSVKYQTGFPDLGQGKEMEQINGKIYLVTNKLNGMQYVGQTVRTVEERMKEHFQPSSAKTELLAAAIQKDGRENFIVEVLEEGITDYRELSYREVFYVATLRTVYPDGYNRTPGGVFGFQWNAKPKTWNPDYVRDYEAGMTLVEIGEKHGKAPTTILKHLKNAGVQRRCGPRPGCSRWEKIHAAEKLKTVS